MNTAPAKFSLAALADVPLSAPQRAMFDAVMARSGGDAVWQARKRAEVRALLALSALTDRIAILALEAEDDLRVMVGMRVPVPCAPDANGELRRADRAVLGISYPAALVRAPLPGTAVVQVLGPPLVFHPNVAPGPVQALCLGPKLPAAIPLKEILLAAYGALSLQAIQLDLRDSAGVMNPQAAAYFGQRLDLIPLSREPFLNLP